MNWIELMGPSGIGKSTFKKKLLQARRKEDRWVLPSEALLDIARNQEYKDVNRRILKYFLNPRVAKAGNGLVFKYLLKFDNAYLKESHKYEGLIDLKIKHHTEKEERATEKAYRISLFKAIITEMCVLDYYGYERTVLMESSPFNHSKDLQKYPFLKNSYSSALPKAFVFCRVDLETNLNRLKDRASKGRTVPLHRGLPEDALKSFVHQKREEYDEKISFLKTLGVPYLELDLTKSHTENVAIMREFLNNICDE